MKYKIVSCYEKYKMEREVEELIKEGWKPQGGICLAIIFPSSPSGTQSEYAQAMTKE